MIHVPVPRQAREHTKIAVRSVLYRFGLDLVKDPFPVRIAHALDHLGLDTVLDVGANIGYYALALRASGFTGRVISCEPLSEAHAELARRAAGDRAWTARHVAVGAGVGVDEINISANSYSSSMLPMNAAHTSAAPGSEYVGTEPIEVTTLAALVTELAVDPRRTLLKMDTQGHEGAVLDGAGGLLGELAAIQTEMSAVRLYDGAPLDTEMVDRLLAAGYALYDGERGFGDPRTGRMLQWDGLYVRHDLMPDEDEEHARDL